MEIITNTKKQDNQIQSSTNENDSLDRELLKPENKNELWVVTKLEENELIKWYWWLDDYLAMKLLYISENALAPDNKWELHIDYKTRLKTLETLLKLKDKNFDKWNWFNINFFASPKDLKY